MCGNLVELRRARWLEIRRKEEIVENILKKDSKNKKISLLAPLVRGRKGHYVSYLKTWKGFESGLVEVKSCWDAGGHIKFANISGGWSLAGYRWNESAVKSECSKKSLQLGKGLRYLSTASLIPSVEGLQPPTGGGLENIFMFEDSCVAETPVSSYEEPSQIVFI